MNGHEALLRNYRSALVGAVSHRSEVALHRAYELGREALVAGVSVLELAQVHHECLVALLRETAPDEVPATAVAASEFFLEALATYDMAQRSVLGNPDAANPGTEEPPAGRRDRRPGRGLNGAAVGRARSD